MATGGIFQLITNDGKQDRMLMATALLNKRLLDIEQIRSRNPKIRDPTPTLVDIEKTHVLFMNAHFKPFAAIGYEYNKVQPQSGQARLGSRVQFSIPQFGDFFNDMVLHARLGAVSADQNTPASELIAYVNQIGARLVKGVRFTVNGNPLDEYDSDVYNFHEAFFVTPNKRVGWNRNMGQEMAHEGFVDVAAGRGAGVRQVQAFVDGPQTPKTDQPAVDLWVPLLFWFNKDPRLSIPSVSIPYGQRFIEVDLAPANELLQQLALNPADDAPGTVPPAVPDVEVCDLWINNIFVNPEIHDIFIKRIGFTLIRVHRQQTQRINKNAESILLNQMKWPIETLYLGLRPDDNTDPANTKMRTGWNVYAELVQRTVNTSALRMGFVVDSRAATFGAPPGGVPTQAQLAAALVPNAGPLFVAADFTAVTVAAINAALNSTVATRVGLPALPTYNVALFADPLNPTRQELIDFAPSAWVVGTYDECVPTLRDIQLQAHGVNLYNVTPSAFFNSYIPYTYGGHHINTPEDCGKLMVTFNLYPGSYQPSGHVNISRAREFYLNLTSNQVGVTIPTATLKAIGIAINFLLISDGYAKLCRQQYMQKHMLVNLLY